MPTARANHPVGQEHSAYFLSAARATTGLPSARPNPTLTAVRTVKGS
jgi:hypothetical protein